MTAALRPLVSIVFLWIALTAQPGLAQPPADLELVEIVDAGFSSIAVRNAGDGSGRLFIAQQQGVIRVVENDSLLGSPFLDISALVDESVSSGSEAPSNVSSSDDASRLPSSTPHWSNELISQITP